MACLAVDLKRRFDWGRISRRAAPKSDAPRRVKARRGVRGKIPAATYSPTRKPCSTIGSGGLNCRVRDGNGWSPSDVATGNFADAQVMCRIGRRKPRSTLVLSIWNEGDGRKNDQAARAISTGQLNALQRLHLRPIDVVVFDGSSGDCSREA